MRRNALFAPVLLFLLSLGSTPASADASDCIDYSGLMHVSHEMDIQGSLLSLRGQEAAVVAGDTLRLLDLSDPKLPIEEGSIALPIRPNAILWTQDALLLSTSGSGGGIYAFELRPPSRLKGRGFVPAVEVSYHTIGLGALANGYFVAVAEDSLHILELAGGNGLRRHASFKLPGKMVLWDIDGNRIVGDSNVGIALFDASNPDTLQLEAAITAWPFQLAGALNGDWLYLIDSQVFRIVSIADLAHPQELGTLPVLHDPYSLKNPILRQIDSTVLVFAEGTYYWAPGFMCAVDTSDPLLPQQAGYLDLQCILSGVSIEETRPYAHVLSGNSAVLKTIDLSHIDNLEYTLSSVPPLSLSKLRLTNGGQRAIASFKGAGLQILDRQPDGSWIDTAMIPTSPYEVANIVCDGRYFYASAFHHNDPCCGIDLWFFVYDLEQRRILESPNVLRYLFMGADPPYHVVRDGNQVVINLPEDNSFCIEHEVGEEPKVVAETALSAVFPVKGAWYALGGSQLNLLEPTQWSTYYLRSGKTVPLPLDGATWMIRSGNYLYVLGTQGIVVLDASDPQSLTVLNSVEVPYAAGSEAAIAGDLLAVSRGGLGLSLYDLSDPTTPSWIGIAPAYHKALCVAIDPNDIFVLDSDLGLLRYPFPCGLDIEVPVFQPFAKLRAVSIDGGLRLSWNLTVSLSWDSFDILRRSGLEAAQTVATLPYISSQALNTDITLPLEQRAGYYSVLGHTKSADYRSEEIRFDPPPLPSLLLQGAVPNPFNPSTEIVYYQSTPTEAALKIYDTRGRLVWTHEQFGGEGWHRVRWDGSDARGNAVASGSYRVVLESQRKKLSKSIMLIR